MPTYAYVCRDCRKKFELIQTLSEHEKTKPACPKCKSKNLDRVWSNIQVHTSKKS